MAKKYYSDCGWLPFGWGKTEATDVCGACCGTSSLTEMKDGKCQVSIDATTAVQTTFEYCRQNNYIANPSGNHSETVRKVCSPVLAGSAQHLNLLDKCTDGFLTDDCRSQLETIF